MRICELEHRRVGLWGAGREGISAYRALRSLAPAREIVVASDAPATATERLQFADAETITFADGPAGIAALESCDAVIRSPGISRYRPEMQRLLDAGVAVTTGTNLWMAEHADARVVAVTGTMGKSTTSALLTHIARHRGETVILAGNMGSPLLDHIAPADSPELWVIELSSYQTADLERSPRVAVVLNIAQDHLDWHGSVERYHTDKLRLLTDRDRVWAVLNARDAGLTHTDPPAHTAWFGTPDGYDAAGAAVTLRGETVLSAGDSPLIGEHNALNICAALTALSALDPSARGEPPIDDLAGALRDFRALPHRLQQIGTIDSVTYVDDSISTVPESTIAALQAFAGRPLVLIAGGYDRDQRYDELARAIVDSDVHAVVCLPDTGSRLYDAIVQSDDRARRTIAPPVLVSAEDLDAAVAAAAAAARPQGVVLLSPAAPSFNAFRDFEERGERFGLAVSRLLDDGDGVAA